YELTIRANLQRVVGEIDSEMVFSSCQWVAGPRAFLCRTSFSTYALMTKIGVKIPRTSPAPQLKPNNPIIIQYAVGEPIRSTILLSSKTIPTVYVRPVDSPSRT